MFETLRQFPIFEGLSDEELRWALDNSREVAFERGDVLSRENDPGDSFYIMLEGELQITRTVNGKSLVMGTTPPGIIGGELALLNGTSFRITAQAILPGRLLRFGVQAFREMFAAAPTLGSRVLQIAAERMMGLATLLKQSEKMAALGKLSAGLAHELNNPAAAARRAASTLGEALPALQAQTLRLNTLGLTDTHLEQLLAFQKQITARMATVLPLSPIEQSDRENELADCFDEHGIDDGWELAATFVAMQITKDELVELIDQFPPDTVSAVLHWLNTSLSADSLLDEIEQSARRISQLVGAIKSYTYMDQAGVQDIDLHQGLENTLTVMHHKLKNINVVRQYDMQMPCVPARGSELNQVWTNLIDNAADAINGKGTIWLITRCENDFAMVEIADDGRGIAPDVMPHIFEPFYTTKEVGVGTGLGLDISYRIIKQHNGTIEVQSNPGLTRFIMRLPIGTATQGA
jgi:signal transduction histidine kinase